MSKICITTMRKSAIIYLFLALHYAISSAQTPPRYGLLNINNLTSWMRHDGISNRSPKNNHGSLFPRGTANVVYQDGMVWGGKAYVDAARTKPAPFNQLIRVGGATYQTGSRAGRIIGFGATAVAADSNAAEARVYRLRRDYFAMSAAELRRDAAETFEEALANITPQQMQTIRAQYERDWNEWPVVFGAPFIDRNGNGGYDSPPPFSANFTAADLIAGNYDEPGIASLHRDQPADQVLWTVYNDLDERQAKIFYSSLPLGLEIQVTLYAYKDATPWAGYYMRRVRIINKGGVGIDDQNQRGVLWIDSMYVGQWSDADVGSAFDDLVGCDTLLQLGYAYNGVGPDAEFHKFKLAPPAVGYSIMQGPRVPASNASAWFDFKRIVGLRNLPMNAFSYFTPLGGLPVDPPPPYYQTLRYYKALKGFAPKDGVHDYYPFPPGMTPGPFPLSGDPVRRTGFIDGLGSQYSLPPSDRRFMISSGPFQLAPGDTQEVIIAFVAGLGVDHTSSITVAKHVAQVVRFSYPYRARFFHPTEETMPEPLPPSYYSLSPNYPNPFTSNTRFDYTLKREAHVRVSIFDLMGREVAVVDDRLLPAGYHRASWNGRDQQGRVLPSGVYFYRLKAGHVELTRKLVLVR
ncbi:MAG: FlgD immunoglobulin-like domain containing protein [candidate division KSB1 bacterium]